VLTSGNAPYSAARRGSGPQAGCRGSSARDSYHRRIRRDRRSVFPPRYWPPYERFMSWLAHRVIWLRCRIWSRSVHSGLPYRRCSADRSIVASRKSGTQCRYASWTSERIPIARNGSVGEIFELKEKAHAIASFSRRSPKVGRQSWSNSSPPIVYAKWESSRQGRRLLPTSSLSSADRSSGDKSKCAIGRDFRPILASLKVSQVARTVGRGGRYRTGKSPIAGLSSTASVFSVEGKEFETPEPEGLSRVTKSAAIPLEPVQRVWRKIHSLCPFDGSLAESPKFSGAPTSAKSRDLG
jgi:hypothetical protein